MSSKTVAAIDVGTNTVLLLVASSSNSGELEVIHERCLTPRLGAGLARSGTLDDESIERTLAALAECTAAAADSGVPFDQIHAVGTAALRRASDAARFLQLARNRLGLSIEVLSEQREALLGYSAVVAAGSGVQTLIVDVGGGSTEVVGDSGRLRLSAPIGAVVLTERFLGTAGHPPLESGGYEALQDAVQRACQRFPSGLARTADGSPRPLMCLGGTATNLACLTLELPRFDPQRAEGTPISARSARAAAARLLSLPLAQRTALPIEPTRTEILPAGLACLAATLERLSAPTARVTTRGLRHAIAKELLLPPNSKP